MIKSTCVMGAACAFLLVGAAAPVAAQQTEKQKQAASAQSALSKSDKRYFDDLAKANLAEVQTGNLAQGKASSSEVKNYAKQMVDEHSKKLEEQRALGREKSAALPSAPDEKHKDAFKKLERLSGAQFDRAYMDQMVKDHEATLKLVKEIASKADDADLKAAAQKAAPDIEKHLEMAKRIAATTRDAAKVSSSK